MRDYNMVAAEYNGAKQAADKIYVYVGNSFFHFQLFLLPFVHQMTSLKWVLMKPHVLSTVNFMKKKNDDTNVAHWVIHIHFKRQDLWLNLYKIVYMFNANPKQMHQNTVANVAILAAFELWVILRRVRWLCLWIIHDLKGHFINSVDGLQA